MGAHREPAHRPRAGPGRSSTTAAGTGRWASTRAARPPGEQRRGRAPDRGGREGRRLPRAPRADRRRAPLAMSRWRRARTFTHGAGRRRRQRGRASTAPSAALTAYRRAIRRPHADRRRLPVIFNDYMNTLMGDPTTERLLPLIAAAAEVGAEYFCIDAGWYAELERELVGHRRRRGSPRRPGSPAASPRCSTASGPTGMVPGLWLEPEVVGVHSPLADRLPADAFFQRGAASAWSSTAATSLDLRHPAAVKHLDEVVDFVVGDLGVGYLKLDYNINAGPGTDVGGLSAGAGLLGAQPRSPGLAGRGARPAPRAGHRELRLRRHAHGLRAAVPAPAPVHQRPAGLPALPADHGGRPGRHHPRAGGIVGLPAARVQRPGDRLHAVRRPARPGPPVRAPRPDERRAAPAGGRRRRRLQAGPGRPAGRGAVLAARLPPLDRLLAGPRDAHAGA